MIAYVTRRLLLIAPVLLGVSLGSFALLHLVPGDPAMILAGQEATEEVLARIRHEHGLDQPLPGQFVVYLGNALRGNLGISIQSRQPVATFRSRCGSPSSPSSSPACSEWWRASSRPPGATR